MPRAIRLLRTGKRNGFFNMGLDEALLESVSKTGLPVLRFYGWDPPAVSAGYFEKLAETVNLEACREKGIDVVRRISGGGTVFHQAEITYSVILPLSEVPGTAIPSSFERLCAAIMEGLALLGIPSTFKPVNDILSGGRKISGNAQIRRMGCLLQHGTVLLDTDPDLMFDLLKIPPGKEKDALVTSARERVVGAREILGKAVSFDEAESALIEGFRRSLDLEYRGHPASDASDEFQPALNEIERALELARDKFSAPEWLNRK